MAKELRSTPKVTTFGEIIRQKIQTMKFCPCIRSLAALSAIFCFLLSHISCNNSGSSSYLKATGMPGEILLVMDNEQLSGAAGRAVEDLLAQSVPALPQDEPLFKVSRSTIEGFSGFLTYVRNVMYVEVDESRFTTTSVKFDYNVWAKGQMLVKMTSPNADSIVSYIKDKGEALVNLVLRHEFYRFADLLHDEFSPTAMQKVDSMFGYRINVPKDIRSYKVGKDFLWMSNNAASKRHDLLVYTYPYRSKRDLEMDRMIEVRDSVLRQNIEGGDEGSYPSTETGFNLYHRYVFGPEKGQMRSELRGLWKMTGGGMMGGPFVCQATYDKESGLVYVAEGFVYHPNEPKRNLIRMMEASLYTFRKRAQKDFNPEGLKKMTYSPVF